MIVYRARPIDRAGGMQPEWEAAMEEMDDALAKVATVVYRPEAAWRVGTGAEVSAGLEQVNRAALAAADCVVAYLPPVPTLGVGREVEAARAAGTPVLLVAPAGAPLWAGADCDRAVLGQAEEAVRWVLSVPRRTPPAVGFVMSDESTLPIRAHEGDAGMDLTVVGSHTVGSGSFADLPTGLRPVFPQGVWGRITGRSSTLRRRGLLVVEGIIDNGYTGPLLVGVWNLTDQPVQVGHGERLAQLVLHSVVADRYLVQQVATTPDTSRGANGFGSSGQ